MYPSFTHEELIIDWFKRSQGEKVKKFTIFDQFISLGSPSILGALINLKKTEIGTCSTG